VHYSEPSAPLIYVDEAEVAPEEVERQFAEAASRAADLEEAVDDWFEFAHGERLLPLPRRHSGPLSAEATSRVGARLAQERREDEALRAAGLLPPKEEPTR